VFELLVDLGAEEHALNFPVAYASGRAGWATRDLKNPNADLRPLFEMIVDEVPAASGDSSAPLQMLITSLDASDYVGRIGIGRIFAGKVRPGMPIALLAREGGKRNARISQVLRFQG